MAVAKNKPTVQAPKADVGTSVKRPKILESSNSNAIMILNAQRARLNKNGKANYSDLPQGVQDSIKKRAHIEEVLNTGVEKTSVSELKSKYDVGTPLNIKKARIITSERNSFFAENRARHTVEVVEEPKQKIVKKKASVKKSASTKKSSKA